MSEHEQISALIEAKNSNPIPLDQQKTALIVVDMQRYFTQPSFPFTEVFNRMSPGAAEGYLKRVSQTVIPSIQKLLGCFRELGLPVVFTAVGTETGDGSDLPCWLRSFDQLGLAVLGNRIWPPVNDPSWQIDEAIAPRPGEPVLNKFSAGTFATTNLEQELRNRGVESVIVTGVSSDVCVATTAREAADRGFKTIVASDACTTLSEEMHRASLQTFNIAFGWLRTSDEIVELLQRPVAQDAQAAESH